VTIGEGADAETIGMTDNHPFWSETHQAFVPVGQLSVGDELLTLHSQKKSLTALLPRPGPPERVYNLEVHGEHTYFVGRLQILVHNNYVWRALNEADIQNIQKGLGVKAPGTNGGLRNMVDVIYSDNNLTKFIPVTESNDIIDVAGSWIRIDVSKLKAGTYISKNQLQSNRAFVREMGDRARWLEQQDHGLVVGGIPMDAIVEFWVNGARVF